jgi:hypothetical protein
MCYSEQLVGERSRGRPQNLRRRKYPQNRLASDPAPPSMTSSHYNYIIASAEKAAIFSSIPSTC